ncbi:hypothetical protein B0H10DRAFT_2238355 [Mycena sp. CBHHK59/15]|nr:hypothetical protein B0H10DRAFT_2238355 [Mycena sp. CBHHK59/15]
MTNGLTFETRQVFALSLPRHGPRGSRDNPDPNFIIKGSRQRIPASDPLNGEPAVAALDALVNQIIVLSRSFPSTIPIATKDDKIYHVITNVQGEDPTVQLIFNRRMDILFAESPACRNSDGRLIHVRRGKLGMDLLIKYLRKIEWAEIPPDLASIKLTRLVTELAALCDTASAPASSDLPAAAAKNLRSSQCSLSV